MASTTNDQLVEEIRERLKQRENIKERVSSIRRSLALFEKNLKDQPNIPSEALAVVVAMAQQVSDSALDLKLWTDPSDVKGAVNTKLEKPPHSS